MNKGKRLKASINKALKIWLMQHAQAFVFSLGQLYKNPLGTALTTAVIGISLALPAGFYLLLENAQKLADNWEDSADISLFLQHSYTEEQAASLAKHVRNMDGVLGVAMISRADALAEYRLLSGFDEALDLLTENPLPNVLMVKPETDLSAADSQALLVRLRQLPQVNTAQLDQQWAQRLFLIMEVAQRTVLLLSVILGFAVLLIVGNTIRLAIYHRRQEIEIHKLFGATNAFIQRPFLYYGLLHGIIGSLIACLLLQSAVMVLHAPVSRLSALYSSDFELAALGLSGVLGLMLAGALLGVSGAFFSVQRHIKTIDPV